MSIIQHYPKIEPPYCQSCGTSIRESINKGTNSDGSRNVDYCFSCFQNGSFTDPNITLNEMIEIVADSIIDQLGTSELHARYFAESFLPTLKRWM